MNQILQIPLSVRIMLVLPLLSIVPLSLMMIELANTPFMEWVTGFPAPARDMSFLVALLWTCALVSWMYATTHNQFAELY